MRRWMLLAASCVVASGCATAEAPSREGSTSGRVVHAYWSKELPTARFTVFPVTASRARGREPRGKLVERPALPDRVTEFDADRDTEAVFVAVLKVPEEPGPINESKVHLTLISPTGRKSEFVDNIKFDRKQGGFWAARGFPVATLKLTPGRWTMHLIVDGEHLGLYPVTVGRGTR